MTDRLQLRAAKFASRVTVRGWEYRQRDHSHGTWFRLRRALAFADAVYEVGDCTMDSLLAEGAQLDPVGAEFEPPKRIASATRERAAAMPGARRLAVRLSPEVLAAQNLVLVPF